jgi:hypothetical protein
MTVSALDKFKNRPGAAPSARPTGMPYIPRHAGVPSNARDPYLTAGHHIVKVLDTADSSYPKPPSGRDGYFKVAFELVWTNVDPSVMKVGDKRTVSQCVTGKSEDTGKGKVKAMLVALCGLRSDDEIDQALPNFDENGTPTMNGWSGLWEAASGNPDCEAVHGKNPLAGMYAEVIASQGNPVLDKTTKQPTGEYYYNYSWAPYTPAE